MKKIVEGIIMLGLVMCGTIVSAQEHVPNQLMIKVEKGHFADDVVEEAKRLWPTADFEIIQPLAQSLNIWMISYDEENVGAEKATVFLEDLEFVAIAQVNHTGIENRNIPDDTNYGSQWCHFNSSDADMDTEEAWSITTGGVTALGDTIVVAVVDGGADLNHEDLDYWKNKHEIPGNGIDDDNNGYVDDYSGWHVYKSGGVISEDENVNFDGFWDDHGIHVSGIIGAIGNNNKGVAGVSWNTKVMAIKGSSTDEAVLVKSYGYIYDQRLSYNRSQGDSGAYVVATNSSFGVNYGDPNSYPIWCGLYDDLGSVGILSAVAGPNLGINIDNEGDVPGACPSNFTFSVTNSTNNDTRNNGAGYGVINCDIAAPGTDIYSTTASNTYGYKTGTSMATPQVAGAVGLMYAAAPAELLQNNIDFPSVTATTIRNYMLTDGFDSIASMDGESVTGGRLNLYKSLQAFEQYDTTSTGIAAKVIENKLMLTPNPVDDRLTISTNIQLASVECYSVLGELVFKKQVMDNEQVDVSSIESGVYFFRIRAKGEIIETQRIVISH